MTTPIIPSIDIRDIPSASIDVAGIMGSDTWLLAADEPAIGYALINLMLRCWHQVPAASIPADDRLLSKYAGLDFERWIAVKDAVLRDWIACDDGRLYHPAMAKQAFAADEARAKREAFSESQRAKARLSVISRSLNPPKRKPSKKAAAAAAAAIEQQPVDRISIQVKEADPRQISIFDADGAEVVPSVAVEVLPAVVTAPNEETAPIDRACKEVFEHYQQKLSPRSKWGPDRKKVIKQWIATKPGQEGKYSVEELKEAIDGNAGSDWYQGNNKQKTAYNTFEFIFRSRDHIEKFQGMARGDVEKNMTPASKLSSAAQRTLNAYKSRQEKRQDRGDSGNAGEQQ